MFPLINTRYTRILKYWFKLLSLDDTNTVKVIYNLLLKDASDNASTTNWASLLRDLLRTNGFGNVWIQQHVHNNNAFVITFNQRIKDVFLQNCHGNITNVSDHRLYKFINMERSQYLSNINERYIRNAIAKLRLGSHSFLVERGRWQTPKLEYARRICPICNDIEDEYHVVLECLRFVQLRKRYLPQYLYVRPSMLKFVDFINTVEGKHLKMFGIFIHKLLNEYNDTVL